jgi:hypothetical protein
MQIRMADPAVKDIDENILRTKIAPFEIKRAKRRSRAVRGVTFNRDHDHTSVTQPMTASKYFASQPFFSVQRRQRWLKKHP